MAEQESSILLPFITALGAISGVVIGAVMQHLLSKNREFKKHKEELRFNAYSDYMQSVGEAEKMKLIPNIERHAEILGKAISAKAQVCLHGSKEAVELLSKFESTDRSLGLTEEKKKYFVEFVNQIRKEANPEGLKVSGEIIKDILFENKNA